MKTKYRILVPDYYDSGVWKEININDPLGWPCYGDTYHDKINKCFYVIVPLEPQVATILALKYNCSITQHTGRLQKWLNIIGKVVNRFRKMLAN